MTGKTADELRQQAREIAEWAERLEKKSAKLIRARQHAIFLAELLTEKADQAERDAVG